jgi:hypothetical protein
MLVGGVAAAMGLALGRFGQPDRAAAATGDPVTAGGTFEADAATTLTNTTSLPSAYALVGNAGAASGVRGSSDSGDGVHGTSSTGFGVMGDSNSRNGVVGRSMGSRAGVVGGVGGSITVPDFDFEAGVVGLGETGTPFASGVWGDSSTGAGVVGSGPWGVYGTGGVGVAGDVGPGGTGVYGFVGSTAAPIPTANVAVEARAGTTSYLALNVVGRAKFSRSGRTLIAAGRSYITISLAGVTSSNLVFANLFTYRAGTWVISATPTTGSFTIRLNKALTSSAYVVWFVLN